MASQHRTTKEGIHPLTYRFVHELRGPHRDRRLLHNDGAWARMLGDDSCDGLKGGHVGGAAGTVAAILCRRVDGDKDDIGLGDDAGHVGREEEVGWPRRHIELLFIVLVLDDVVCVEEFEGLGAIAGHAHNVVEAGFVDGRVARVPPADAHDIAVDDGDV